MTRVLALVLTALTGFSGLVYEVAWQKYLATMLGSHSEATSAVLGIFLGGLSVGYWLFGVVTRRIVSRAEAAGKPPRLLMAYGLLEGGIGAYVIAFPWIFKLVQALSYAIPHGAGGIGFAVDVLLSALLIGPASILMGGTIPMLTQALSRSLDDATRFHAFVYAFNTAGAFVGALAAGFFLIPALGLERAMLTMGLINLAAGGVFILAGIRGKAVVSLADEEGKPVGQIEGFRVYALVALLTGFAMMTMQTTVIRIGVLSIGSAQFTFSMVVAVFVFAIALGSFIVSAFDQISSRIIVLNQWGIALFFLILYPRLDEAPYLVMVIRTLFRDTDAAFVAHHFLTFLLLAAMIGLPVILSGAALPLLFHHMRRQVGHLGDLAGYLYSWNTVGSLLGALLGGYALLFWLDLHEVYRIALVALVVAAFLLTRQIYQLRIWSIAATISLLAATLILPAWNPHLLYAALFRQREPLDGIYDGAEEFLLPRARKILFATDDPSVSVVVQEYLTPNGGVLERSLSTNGKADGGTGGDSGTTGLLAILPAIFAKQAESAFVIGWGIGNTAGELASLESMKRVDVAEISLGVVEAAPFFDTATQNASSNPKIHVIQSDAYRALMRRDDSYDVIVSAPSHLWVVGVEMLFSHEFLEATKAKLNPGGVYAQFLHRYEIDDESLSIALHTFTEVYDHVAVWQDVNGSLQILGFLDSSTSADHFRLAQQYERPDFKAALERSGLPTFPSLLAHEILPADVINTTKLDGPIHSLYRARLHDLSGRALFRGDYASMPFTGFGEPARIGAKNSLLKGYASRSGGRLPDAQRSEMIIETCRTVGIVCNTLLARWLSEEPESEILKSTIAGAQQHPDVFSLEELVEMGRLFRSDLDRRNTTPEEAERLTDRFVDLYHHAAPFDPNALLEVWGLCREGQATEDSCRKNVQQRVKNGSIPASSFDDELRQCMSRKSVGARCQSGYDEARKLVEFGDGVTPDYSTSGLTGKASK